MTHLLVVDYYEPDLELLVRQTFRKAIQSGKLQMHFAHSAPEAVTFLMQEPQIEVVLTDVKIKLDNGQDLLEYIASLKRLLKTIVVCPYGDMEAIRMAMNRGAFDFIIRPINLKDLEVTVMKTIEQLQRIKEAEQTHSRLKAIEKELDVAKNIQQSILPSDFLRTNTFEIYGTMLPARRVGGDFYDFFKISSDKMAFTIADVSGKGVPAALFMTMTRGLLRAFGQKTGSPLQCIQQVNELIVLENDSSMFVTAFCALFDEKKNTIEYCNAGHNPPYLLTAQGELKQIGRCDGIALGVVKEKASFVQRTIELEAGDLFLMYTDGVTEAMNQEGAFFQEKGLEALLLANRHLPLPALLHAIVSAVQEFSKGCEQTDDITLFGLKIQAS